MRIFYMCTIYFDHIEKLTSLCSNAFQSPHHVLLLNSMSPFRQTFSVLYNLMPHGFRFGHFLLLAHSLKWKTPLPLNILIDAEVRTHFTLWLRTRGGHVQGGRVAWCSALNRQILHYKRSLGCGKHSLSGRAATKPWGRIYEYFNSLIKNCHLIIFTKFLRKKWYI